MCEKLLPIYSRTSPPRHKCCTATTELPFTFIRFFYQNPLSPQLTFGLSITTPRWGLSAGSAPQALPPVSSQALQVLDPASHSPSSPAPPASHRLQDKGAAEQSPPRLDTSTQSCRCSKLQFKSSLSSEHHNEISPRAGWAKPESSCPPSSTSCSVRLSQKSVTIQRPKRYLLSIYYNFFLAGFSM